MLKLPFLADCYLSGRIKIPDMRLHPVGYFDEEPPDKALFFSKSKKSGGLQNFRHANLVTGVSVFCQMKSNLIMVSITPFGQEGPYKSYKGSDLVTSAMGGFV